MTTPFSGNYPLLQLQNNSLFSFHKRHGDQVLGNKPYLQFIGANHLAHQQVIRAVVPGLVGSLRLLMTLFENQFVRFQQA